MMNSKDLKDISLILNKQILEYIREDATRMWIDETRPVGIEANAANVYYIIKAFCKANGIPMKFEADRKSTEVVDDIN